MFKEFHVAFVDFLDMAISSEHPGTPRAGAPSSMEEISLF